jgi:hypothetical protein
MESQDFAYAPANPVAHDRAAQGFFNAGAETGVAGAVAANKNNELRTRAPLAPAIDRFVFDAAQQTRGTREAEVPSRCRFLRRA